MLCLLLLTLEMSLSLYFILKIKTSAKDSFWNLPMNMFFLQIYLQIQWLQER